MIILSDFLATLHNSDRVRILRGGEDLFTGYLAFINGMYAGEDLSQLGLDGTEEVKHFNLEVEIRHKDWQKLGLMAPLRPEQLPEYQFSDLQMNIYRVIVI